MDPSSLCPGKGLVLPTPNIDQIAKYSRFFVLSLPDNKMSNKSPFAIHKALLGIGGEPRSVKKLRSGDLLIETKSALQSKSFLSAKTFLDSPLIISPHKSLNSCRGVISEPDLLYTSETEILDGFSDQGVIQVRRITIRKDATFVPTKHLILTFHSPKLPTAIKAGYLNCQIRPYVPNPLRCFKCQRFGHSQTSCRGQLTCSRCASVGHSSTDCNLEPKCVNCLQSHPSDSKLCSKWKTEKQIQEIKTNKNISYLEARKFIAPQIPQTYAQVAKPSTISNTTQTDANITKIICPPLKCLKPLSSSTMPVVSTSSLPTQTNLIPSTTSISSTVSQSSISISNTTSSSSNNVHSSISPLPTPTLSLPTKSGKFTALPTENQPSDPVVNTSAPTSSKKPSTVSSPLNAAIPNSQPSTSTATPAAKKNTIVRTKKRSLSKSSHTTSANKPKIDIKMAPHKTKKSTPVQEESDEEMWSDVEGSDVLLQRYGEYLHVLTPTRNKNNRN